MGQNGGAVFLLVYLILIVTICFIPMMAELSLGKLTKKECISTYEYINPKLKILGALNPITGIIIAAFYFVVSGWIINYIIKSFYFVRSENYGDYFNSIVQNGMLSTSLTLAFLLICVFTAARGLKKGIEFANNILMPLFAIILICLIYVSLTLPNSHLGLEYMFMPDFSKLNGSMVLAALGQAFFTLSIGMGALLTYGSYIQDDKSITKSAYTIVIADTMFAILAGIMIFPAVFSFNLEPSSGAGLVFVTLPQIFSQIPNGNNISCAFFILLFCAAVTSGISIIEAPISTLIARCNISRIKASIYVFFMVSVLAIPASLSFGIMEKYKIFGKSIFDFLDFLTANIMLPLNTLFLCIIVGWILKGGSITFIQNKFLEKIFNIGLKFVIPIVLVLLFYFGLKN